MQTLTATSYNALDAKSRNPNARVKVKRNYDSIPFEGKSLQSTLTSEKYPKHFLHSDGRLCLVYSKYNSVSTKWDLYYKATNTDRTLWSTAVDIQSDSSYHYYKPTSIQINSGNNIGIITSRADTDLYSCIINTSGVIQTALADTTINGTHPTLTKIGTTYWLAYERSGVLYYRTSADFSSWSAETNLNTITGLSNDHFNPYMYYDTSSKLWVTFERVSDAASNPVVKNVYTMLSNDNGSTWDSPVAQTVLVAGEGSCLNPSIVDTSAHRYVNYTLEQQLQQYQDTFGDTNNHNYFVVDETNNRVGMITGTSYGSGQYLCIYDRDTDTYVNHDLKVHGMTSGNITCLAYDEDNKIWAIGTSADGIITYDENTTTWANYTKSTTPALLGYNIFPQIMAFEDKKLYFTSYDSGTSYTLKLQKLDITAGTNTEIGAISNPNASYTINTFLSSSYVVNIIRANNVSGYKLYHPRVTVINKSTNVKLYEEDMSEGSQYNCAPTNATAANSYFIYAQFAFDEINNAIYSLATDTNQTDDNGIIKYTVGDSALTFSKYYSQLAANPTGLLPNPDQPNDKVAFINNLVYNSTNNRLYIEVYATINSAGGTGDHAVSVLNTNTDLVVENYASSNSDYWTANWASIDNSLIKVLPVKTHFFFSLTSMLACTDDKELIFWTDKGSGDRYFWNILTTEGVANRVYYRKTSDNITWTTQAYLTNSTSDSYCNLGYSDSRLKAIWNRTIDGIEQLRWDEDLSSEIDVSEYVESFTIDKTDEHSSNKATIILSDSLGLFDPLNYSSLKHDYFAENNIIDIDKGNNGAYNDAFYGLIGTGESTYKRGEQIVYRIDVWDKSKNFFKKKITTPFFENQTVEYIADYVAANYMELSAGEYNTLPAITDVIPTVEFIGESVMDILFKIYQPYNYFPWFDESGNLKAKEYNYDASTDFTYYKDGTDTVAANKVPAMNIIGFDYEWTDKELVNRVTVIGETEATTETTFPEEFLGFIQGAAGWFSKSTNFTFWFSTDKTLYCEEPRLSVTDSCGNKFFGGGESLSTAGSGKQLYCTITQTVSNLIAALYVLIGAALAQWFLAGVGVGTVIVTNPLAGVLAMALTILGQIGNFYYEIYGRPVGDALPDTIEAVANDTDLQAKYGIISMEIDNPFLDTYVKCLNLADNELEKAKWFRYIVTLRICANQAHQIGDVIYAYNKHTDEYYKLFVTDASNEYSRGNADVDIIRGALIT